MIAMALATPLLAHIAPAAAAPLANLGTVNTGAAAKIGYRGFGLHGGRYVGRRYFGGHSRFYSRRHFGHYGHHPRFYGYRGYGYRRYGYGYGW